MFDVEFTLGLRLLVWITLVFLLRVYVEFTCLAVMVYVHVTYGPQTAESQLMLCMGKSGQVVRAGDAEWGTCCIWRTMYEPMNDEMCNKTVLLPDVA